jgi:DNA invertase Pin-like site-specific DNA recombinase
MRIGYGRVSTRDQNLNSQHDALTAAGCERIFVDKRSGKLASRPELDRALDVAREGDQFVITRLGRLGNSLLNLLELTERLRTSGIDLVVLEQGIDTSTPAGKLAFHVLASVMQFQRELIVDGTYDGLASARARGRTGGQKPKLTPRQAKLAREMYDSREFTVAEIAAEFRVSRPTIYRHIDKLAK